MNGPYQSTFIIPADAQRVLSDAGWEFSSNARISQEIADALMASLSLVKTDSYLGIEEFSGGNVKAIVSFDDDGLIEHICIRTYKGRDVHPELFRALSSFADQSKIEFFGP